MGRPTIIKANAVEGTVEEVTALVRRMAPKRKGHLVLVCTCPPNLGGRQNVEGVWHLYAMRLQWFSSTRVKATIYNPSKREDNSKEATKEQHTHLISEF